MSSSSTNSKGSGKSIGRYGPATHCSTPSGWRPLLKPSVSVSTLESGSSPGEQEKQTIELKKQPRRKKPVLRRKRKKQKAKSTRVEARSSDTDWETKSQCSVLGHVGPEEIEGTRISADAEREVLFETLGSPESVREAVYSVEECGFLSPIVRSRREQNLPLINESLEEPNAPLPLKDVQCLSQRDFDSAEDEEDCQLRACKRSKVNIKTYSRPVRQPRYFPTESKIQHWLVPLRPRVAASNLLWDEFTKKRPKQVRRILESESSDEAVELGAIFQRYHAIKRMKNNKPGDCAVSSEASVEGKINGVRSMRKQNRRQAMISKSPEVEIISGWWDRSNNKWVHDSSILSSDEDDDVQINSGTERRIAHSKVCEKYNKPRIRSIETLTTLKSERIDKMRWKISKK